MKTVVRNLNAKLKAQFNNLGVSNRTRLVMDATKVLTKVSLIYKAEGKVKLVTKDVAHLTFFCKVIFKGLPSFWDGHGDLYTTQRYRDILQQVRNDATKFTGIEGTLSGHTVMQLLSNDFEILATLKSDSLNFPLQTMKDIPI